jgi:hypothetical protein
VFFAGGYRAAQAAQPTSVIDIYDNTNQSWSTANLNKPANLSGIASMGQRLLFVGRFDVDVYDATTDTWSIFYLSPINFSDLSLVNSAGGNVYIVNRKMVWRVEL